MSLVQNKGHVVVARRDAQSWKLLVEHLDGTCMGITRTHALADAADQARDLISRGTGVDQDNTHVAVRVEVPTATEVRLELAEELCDDAAREVESAIGDLVEANYSVADIGFILRHRRHFIADPVALRPTPPAQCGGRSGKPDVGDIVVYRTPVNDGPGNDVLSPAIVVRTRDRTGPATPQCWAPEVWSGAFDDMAIVHDLAARPDEPIAELPDDTTVDLVVFGLSRCYWTYSVPEGSQRGQWAWRQQTRP